MGNNVSDVDLKTVEGMVVCETSGGVEIHGTLVRLTRHAVSFEIHNVSDTLQMSEVLANLKILTRGQPIYSGRAVITNLVEAGPVLLCQANLRDTWAGISIGALAHQPAQLRGAFAELVQGWEKIYRIQDDYKLVVADIQSFLHELCHWADELETGIASGGKPDVPAERQAVAQLVAPITPCLNHLFERFELCSNRIAPELQPAHGLYAKRQLHPLLLCSPFMHRIYRKPLGYAGDYEMVSMILRDPHEGGSLFAKLLNTWFLSQSPAEAHRNRVKYLTARLREESLRAVRGNRRLRVLNLGCGPAGEVHAFMREDALCNHANLTLLDFNDETIRDTGNALRAVNQQFNRTAEINMVKRSVHQVLKDGSKGNKIPGAGTFDFVYCAGLFDYLTDRTCKQLMNIFHELLAPGGLLVATNVDSFNPIRNIMGYIFEWKLVERNGTEFMTLTPDKAPKDNCRIMADVTGCNIFLECRKPEAPA
jgi:extracellular factor (EF) 3-hydroxypalmitic acid methyl ester biosynthesis protein